MIIIKKKIEYFITKIYSEFSKDFQYYFSFSNTDILSLDKSLFQINILIYEIFYIFYIFI